MMKSDQDERPHSDQRRYSLRQAPNIDCLDSGTLSGGVSLLVSGNYRRRCGNESLEYWKWMASQKDWNTFGASSTVGDVASGDQISQNGWQFE